MVKEITEEQCIAKRADLKRRVNLAKKKKAKQQALDAKNGISPFVHYYERKIKLWDKNKCHISLQETKHPNDARGSDWGFEIRQYTKTEKGKVVPVRGNGILIPTENGKGRKFTKKFLRVYLDSTDNEGAEHILKWLTRQVEKKLNGELEPKETGSICSVQEPVVEPEITQTAVEEKGKYPSDFVRQVCEKNKQDKEEQKKEREYTEKERLIINSPDGNK